MCIDLLVFLYSKYFAISVYILIQHIRIKALFIICYTFSEMVLKINHGLLTRHRRSNMSIGWKLEILCSS